jgi:hypothetical protein
MIVYHGSYAEVPSPDTLHSRKNVDFGQGLYVTPLYEQAAKWCLRFKKDGLDGFVSRYTLDEEAFTESKVLTFESYSEEWLDFVLLCRSGKDGGDHDIVGGGVADDRVFNTIELYTDGLIEKKEALKRLKYEKPNYQICLCSQDVIDKYLHFEGSERL